MQSVGWENHKNPTQTRDDPSGTDAGENIEWIDRLKDCNRRIDDLRLKYSNVLTTQVQKWNDFVQPPELEGMGSRQRRKPQSGDICQSLQNVCSSTPISLRQAPTAEPQPKSSDLTGTGLARTPAKAVVLFGENYSEDVGCQNNFEWVITEDDNKPDDDFEGNPIGKLEPSTMKAALANQMLTEPQNDPLLINASWNPNSMDRTPDSGQDSDHPHSREFNDDAGRSLDWLDRLRNCVQKVGDLGSRYRDALSVQAKKWDNIAAETFNRTQPSDGLLLRRPRNLGSSTPISMNPKPSIGTQLAPMGPTETNLGRANSSRVILFGDDNARNENSELNIEWTTAGNDDEPDDDFRSRPIGRLSPSTLRNALGSSKVSKQVLVT